PRCDELSRRQPRTRPTRPTSISGGMTMTQPSRRKGGLGRGLASLIPTGPAEDESGSSEFGPRMGDAAADVVLWGPAPVANGEIGALYREIDPALIEPNPRQPRQSFREESLAA